MYGNCFFFIFFFKKIESMFIFIFLLLISNGVSCEEKNILNNEFINGTGNNIDVILNHLISQYSARSQFEEYFQRHENCCNTHSPRIVEWLDKKFPSSDYRLPADAYPLTYDIHLTPCLEEKNFTFNGNVKIVVQATKNISSIVLHAKNLNIKNISAVTDSERILNVSSYTIDSTTDKFSIYFTSVVTSGTKFFVIIDYTGILNDKMLGFYRSSYKDENGKIHWLAITQFHKFGAREAFPCFDEPALKAKFTIHIERPTNYHSISNMPKQSSNLSKTKNRTWDHYEESVIMSSYLVAFSVFDFDVFSNKNNTFRIWTRPSAIESAKAALEIGKKVLNYLQAKTGINYPISKMDFVACPDMNWGGMENWGEIHFKESALLTLKGKTSAFYERRMNLIVAHELAHIYFGNLVTNEWWNYAWMNEGFAVFMEWTTTDKMYPEWKAMEQFLVTQFQVALSEDSSPMMRPMNNVMEKPSDDGPGNSAIIYQKAGSVIYMMSHAFGAEVLSKALNNYLEKNQYSTATPDKLWSALQASVDAAGGLRLMNESVKTLMDTWASQPGYPIVHVSVTKNLIELKQNRFLMPPNESTVQNQVYWVPISIVTKSKPDFNRTSPVFWFGKKSQGFKNDEITHDEWYIINVKSSGFYRVNYDLINWQRLIVALQNDNFNGIHVIDRTKIIDDLLNLFYSNYISCELALNATEYLKNEVNYLPWVSFFNAIEYLGKCIESQEIKQSFDQYVLQLIEKVYDKLGFLASENDTQIDRLHRQLILSWACRLGHSDCVEKMKEIFADLKKNPNDSMIDPDIKPALYCTALEHGEYSDWEFLWEQYQASDLESEKFVIINALGCTKSKEALDRFFKIALSGDGSVRKHNIKFVFASALGAGAFGINATLDFLVSNYKMIHDYYDSWEKVGSMFEDIANKISTQDQFNKLKRFASETNELAEISESLKTSLETATQNLNWYDQNSGKIFTWLK